RTGWCRNPPNRSDLCPAGAYVLSHSAPRALEHIPDRGQRPTDKRDVERNRDQLICQQSAGKRLPRPSDARFPEPAAIPQPTSQEAPLVGSLVPKASSMDSEGGMLMSDSTQGNQDRFPLADLIAVLGSELREAERRAAQSGARNLQLKECLVQMGIQWEKKGS